MNSVLTFTCSYVMDLAWNKSLDEIKLVLPDIHFAITGTGWFIMASV
jgi:hypothetical protein